jgi:diadenosine tetraphosphate (Ap4A) HIT family hydrolase
MIEFKLNETLKADTYPILEDDRYIIRLSKNALFPWFLIIPKCEKIEFFELSHTFKEEAFAHIDNLSRFLKNELEVDKINIATIGNVVSQLHIHVVGRGFNDPCFPDTVWGCREFREYERDELSNLLYKIETKFLKIDSNI